MLISGKNRCINCFREIISEGGKCICGFSESEYQSELHWLAPGTFLDNRYCVGRVLGEGGFGITYVGYDTNLDIKVAIKEFYLNGYSSRNNTASSEISVSSGNKQSVFETYRDKFINEARILAKFNDEEGVVSVLNFFKTNNSAYIIMEFLDGQTLKDYLQESGTIPAEIALKMFMPIINTLNKIHSYSLVHRDISPDNIILTKNGKLKLIDFGAARDISDGEKTLSVVLKHGYAPLEQYSSHGNQGPWTDIYALSATIYKCLTSVTPTEATDRSIGELLKPPHTYNPSVPTSISAVLLKGMHPDISMRYHTMGEFGDALMKAYSVQVPSSDDETVLLSNQETPAPFLAAANSASVKEKTKKTAQKIESGKKKKKSKSVLIAAAGIAAVLFLFIIYKNFVGPHFSEKNKMAETDTELISLPEETVEQASSVPEEDADQDDKLKADSNMSDIFAKYLVIDETDRLCGFTEEGKLLENIELIIPDNVTSIAEKAFAGCTSIKSVSFSSNSKLNSIGESAFDGCSNIESFDIPNSVKFIGARAFKGTRIKAITFPKSVNEVWTGVCENCSSLRELTILSNDIQYKTNASGSYFAGCNLSKVTFGPDITKINDSLFRNSGFAPNTEIIIPAKVEYIGNYAFCNSGVTSVKFEKNSKLTSIGESAFDGCSNIESFDIPNSVKFIGARAFKGTRIKSITFPESVTEVWTGVCENCSSLRELTILSNDIQYKTNASGSYFAGCNLSKVTFGPDITKINDSLFRNSGFAPNTEIIIPAKVEYIGNYAFCNSGITSVKFEDNSVLTSIGESAFDGCSNIESFDIPNSVKFIGARAFKGTRIKSITFPESVTEVWTGVCENCSALTKVTLLSNNIQFKTNASGSYFAGCSLAEIEFGENVDTIPDQMFRAASFSSVAKIEIPDTITAIGKLNFTECPVYMSEIYIPASVQFIGENVFDGCGENTLFKTAPKSYTTTWATDKGLKVKEVLFP